MSLGLKKLVVDVEGKTKLAIVTTNLLNESLFSIYALLAIILRKDLGATTFQISILMMLKPFVSLFSSYWNARIGDKKKLRDSVFWAGILARVPFLLFPFFSNVWFFIVSAAFYMLFLRASTPAWMEILKLNLPKKEREKHFSIGSSLGYAEGVLIAMGFGFLLDHYLHIWKLLFVLSALLGIVGVFMQRDVPIRGEEEKEASSPKQKEVHSFLLAPWKAGWELMRANKNFARFQWGFMACGFGIMLIQPALPLFFVDVLHLSYTDLAIAFSICKGLGFVFSSSTWAKWMSSFSVEKLSGFVFLATGCFPLFLLLAPLNLFWLYLAYVAYGIAQAGSHLVWNLSGPMFSEKEDSSLYTNVNIAMVGIRGMIAPPLGGALSALLGPVSVFVFGILFCVVAAKTMGFKTLSLFKKASDI